MKALIEQAFHPFKGVRSWIRQERYDLKRDGEEVIVKSVWEHFIKPGASFVIVLHPAEYYDEEPQEVDEILRKFVEVSESPSTEDLHLPEVEVEAEVEAEVEEEEEGEAGLIPSLKDRNKDVAFPASKLRMRRIPWSWLLAAMLAALLVVQNGRQPSAFGSLLAKFAFTERAHPSSDA